MIWAGVALAALTALRLWMAAILPLAPDEAYYWIWSHALAPGYLDHPPMVALWIWAGTALAGETPLGVRLLGPIAAALGTLLLADAAERLLPGRRAGLVAGALLNGTLFLGVGSVVMTPDSPLLLFWTATIWALARIAGSPPPGGPASPPPPLRGRVGVGGIEARTGGYRPLPPTPSLKGRGGVLEPPPAQPNAASLSGHSATPWWALAGLFGGLALCSKYTAAFLGLGIGLWLLASPPARRNLRQPGPWLGLAIALGVFAPVVLWNADHDWAGFLRQGGRVGAWQADRAAQFLAELIGGQAGLATPLVWALCIAGIVLAASRTWRTRDPAWTLLAALTVPPTLYFVWYALGARVQGNWPGIVYPAAAIAAAGLAQPLWTRLRAPAVGLGLGITVLAYLHAATWAVPMPVPVDPIALRLADWDRVATQVEAARQRAGATFVVADQYAIGAELAWIMPPAVPVLGIEDRWRLFTLPTPRPLDGAGILVRDSRDLRGFDPTLWRSAEPIGEVSRTNVQTLRLFRVVPTGAVTDTVTLPRPGLR